MLNYPQNRYSLMAHHMVNEYYSNAESCHTKLCNPTSLCSLSITDSFSTSTTSPTYKRDLFHTHQLNQWYTG